VDLYRQLHAEGSNLFFSPASIAGALSMTSIGAPRRHRRRDGSRAAPVG
jgi:serine protease inhibitor